MSERKCTAKGTIIYVVVGIMEGEGEVKDQ